MSNESEQPRGYRLCAIIPTYNNAPTVRAVVERVARALPVLLVNDGSEPETAAICSQLAEQGLCETLHLAVNSGKGGAVHAGMLLAQRRGFSHALQVDADGQHDLSDLAGFAAVSQKYPQAVILGTPKFDASAPLGRRLGRKISVFFVRLETISNAIVDPLCGFRVYPVDAAVRAGDGCGKRMDFDPEIAVRLAWDQVPMVSFPTKVHYPEGGVSHFRMLRDNLRISWMHTRLCISGCMRPVLGRRIRGEKILDSGR